MATMPQQKPGHSEQSVRTPKEFLDALKKRLFISEFEIDLAADKDNTVAPFYYDEEKNSLIQPWLLEDDQDGWSFCNPPYSDIAPWVKKAYEESANGAKIAVLIPSSTGSNWWAQWVNNKAYITYLNGRITFVGHSSPYPKDLAVLLYAPYLAGGSCVWRWKK